MTSMMKKKRLLPNNEKKILVLKKIKLLKALNDITETVIILNITDNE